jgi:hypothetical protein
MKSIGKVCVAAMAQCVFLWLRLGHVLAGTFQISYFTWLAKMSQVLGWLAFSGIAMRALD